MKKIFNAVVVVALGWFIGSPYVTVHQIKTAIEEDNDEALMRQIDFPALRENFKEQLQGAWQKKMGIPQENRSLGGLVGAGFGNILIDTMVDEYVTPSALTEMMRWKADAGYQVPGRSPDAEHETVFADARLRYQAWDTFAIILPGDEGDVLKLILQRRGIGWKLTGMVVPSGVWD
ncbi:DUF2939 domain-containing protein [Pontiella agarivorans]|uniref:DUF2939 domain-containing protein n=1 Tax=Pontiella agarivorans TaxID=3038953 RepID=A0ABU5MW00_9BACT|nr:DUF2939 domain-containing protein [Pontiella agarivorans]MDZ8118261.1 DUF2939 domain-containing protein [Pontiella agarivorans]